MNFTYKTDGKRDTWAIPRYWNGPVEDDCDGYMLIKCVQLVAEKLDVEVSNIVQAHCLFWYGYFTNLFSCWKCYTGRAYHAVCIRPKDGKFCDYGNWKYRKQVRWTQWEQPPLYEFIIKMYRLPLLASCAVLLALSLYSF